ncbi:glycosyltransferase [Sphingomonas sp. ASV193]|uniref:glycosyltransferase n=1 Tax=Sphingomonas sp. ASV193 TaxID=3144405 RepID=UPI0032E8FD86
MRIVDVCAFYSPQGGGVKTYIERKMRAAPQLGHELVVVAPGERDEVVEVAPGALLHTIPAPFMPLDRRYHYFDDEAALHAALDRWKPDHIEASSPWSSASMVARYPGPATRSLVMHSDPLASYAYRWFGPVVSQKRIDHWFDWFWRHLRSLDRRFDVVVTPNRDLERRLRAGGLEKVTSVPFGVDSELFSPSLRAPDLRADWLARLGLGADATLLLSVGRFGAEKRWPMVLKAAAAAGKRVPAGLVLVGDGPHAPKLERIASRLPHVTVAPPIKDRLSLATLMASADALVHGCESETFCLVASEAKASGLPLIVPDRGGAFAQLDEATGYAYASGDRKALAEAIEHFAVRRSGIPARADQARASVTPIRTMDQHFVELFALYLIGLPFGGQVGDLVTSIGSAVGIG